jgi:hypothetical protein
MVSESALSVARLARTLQDLGIPYVIAGSFASSLHGIPRTTQDVLLQRAEAEIES